jgi:type IV pilus assembly protein PilM
MNDQNFLLRYFPAPNFLDMPFVGIDISPRKVRMIEIIDHPALKVGKYAEATLSKEFLITDEDKSEVRDILKKWKKEYKLEHIKASLPEEKAYLFDTEIELGTEEKMRASIEFSLEENVPLSGAEAIFDFRLVGKSEKEGFVKVAVTVLPREVVDSYLSFFKECDLHPLSFLSEAQALARSLIKRGDKGTYLIVNINIARTGVFVISNGAVQFTSTITMGAQDFSKAIQNGTEMTAEEIEQLKASKGYARSGESDALQALIASGAVFRQEIQKVCVYWAKHRSMANPSEAIQKVILSGKESLTLGFKEYLNQTLSLPIEIGNVWTNLNSFDQYIPPLSFATSLDYGTAIGLASPEKE